MSEAHVHVDPSNQTVALFIAVLALVLAFSETLGKAAQTTGLASHIEASNLWSFFQAKTIRQTTVRTAAIGTRGVRRGPNGRRDGLAIAPWPSRADFPPTSTRRASPQ